MHTPVSSVLKQSMEGTKQLLIDSNSEILWSSIVRAPYVMIRECSQIRPQFYSLGVIPPWFSDSPSVRIVLFLSICYSKLPQARQLINDGNLLLIVLGAEKLKIKVTDRCFLMKALFLLIARAFLLNCHMIQRPGTSLNPFFFFLNKNTNPMYEGQALTT